MNEDKYIQAVRRSSGTSFNAQDEGTYINAIRRVSGTNLSLPIPGTVAASNQLVGHANAGVISATRRLSGVKAAIAESVIVTGDKSLNPIQIELTLRPGQNLTGAKDEDEDKYGLGKSPWHTMSPDEIFTELGTRMSGLTSDEHKQYLEKYGLNQITPPATMHWFVKFLWTLIVSVSPLPINQFQINFTLLYL